MVDVVLVDLVSDQHSFAREVDIADNERAHSRPPLGRSMTIYPGRRHGPFWLIHNERYSRARSM
jgi:hypothetical protein